MPEFTRDQKPKQRPRTAGTPTNGPARSAPGQKTARANPYLQHAIGNQSIPGLQKPNSEALNASSNATASARFAFDFTRISIFSPTALRVQPKLMINTPDDRYEEEADRVAEQVINMPSSSLRGYPVDEKPAARQIRPLVQRQSLEEEEEVSPGGIEDSEKSLPVLESAATEDADKLYDQEEDEFVQTKRQTSRLPFVTSGLAMQIQSLKNGGQPLSPSERGFFEPRFKMDFRNVRVHTDDRAAQISRSIQARAFTLGRDIVFAQSQFAPKTTEGIKLLAHELTHVVQQNAASSFLSGKGRLNMVPGHGRDGSETDRVPRVAFSRVPGSRSVQGLSDAKVNNEEMPGTSSSRKWRGGRRFTHYPEGFRSSEATSDCGILMLQRSPAPTAGNPRPGSGKRSTTARLVIKAPTKPRVTGKFSAERWDVLSIYVGGVLVLEAGAPSGQLKFKLSTSWDGKTFRLSFTPGRGARIKLSKYLEHRLRRALPGARIIDVPNNDTVAQPLPALPKPKPSPTLIGRVLNVRALKARLMRTPEFLGASVLTMHRGAPVKILGWKGSWYRVRYRGREGWVHRNRIITRRIHIRSGGTGTGTSRGEAELSARG